MPIGDFIFHGSFKTKRGAVKRERSASCRKRGRKVCFVRKTKIRGRRRFTVLERKR